jgi:hypothetical protein
MKAIRKRVCYARPVPLSECGDLLTVAGVDGPGRTALFLSPLSMLIHQWMEATECWMLPVQASSAVRMAGLSPIVNWISEEVALITSCAKT